LYYPFIVPDKTLCNSTIFYCIAHYRIIERPLHRLFKEWLGI